MRLSGHWRFGRFGLCKDIALSRQLTQGGLLMSGRTKNTAHQWKVKGPEYGTLCLSREAGESVLIGDQIEVLVIRIRGQVTFSIRAPKAMKIVRAELCE